MRNSTKEKISRDSQKMYVVTSKKDSRYKRHWKKASLAQFSKSIYGVTLSDWMKVYKGRYGQWVLNQYQPENVQ